LSVSRLEQVKRRCPRFVKMLAARQGGQIEPPTSADEGGELTQSEILRVFEDVGATGLERRVALAHLFEPEWGGRKFKPDASYIRGWIMRGRLAPERMEADPPSSARVIPGGRR
jgi:hypothetical protein